MATSEWFVNCPRGLESLLAEELMTLGAESVRETVAGVYARGSLELAYRACLWSRLANRVFLPLGRFRVSTADDLYVSVAGIDWSAHMTALDTLAVDFIGESEHIRHTRFGAQRVKDAIVDGFSRAEHQRPEVDLRHPDIRINAHLARGSLVVSLDLSGQSLHRRGYRVATVPAPMKENLAAAILLRAGWPEIRARGGGLIDPFCGSGTLLIEAAMMAADIAPGLLRAGALRESPQPSANLGSGLASQTRPGKTGSSRGQSFGFRCWKQHDEALWQHLVNEALERRQRGLATQLPEMRGYDKDTRAVTAAQQNIAAMGLEQQVRVSARPVQDLKRPTHTAIADGLIICNPPYGERWGEVEELKPLYRALGQVARAEFPGWRLAVFTGNPVLAGELRLRSDKKYKLFNGTIPSDLLLFSLRSVQERREKEAEQTGSADRDSPGPSALSDGALMFANRLQKNHRKLQPWLRRTGVSCYRLYDGDIPEYAVAVDIYQPMSTSATGDQDPAPAIHVQEYAAPATIDEAAARRHLDQVREALYNLFPASRDRIFFKERRRQRGDNQYRRLAQSTGTFNTNSSNTKSSNTSSSSSSSGNLIVAEGEARFEVNLADYLDTGLFLDHRPVRQMLRDMAAGCRFLNLFCYTATATVQAALGGAGSSLSIDMSNTYCRWAERNLALNGLDVGRHRVERADCLAWLAERRGQYDLILLDPPTFSNSSNTDNVLDIQRDHGRLIRQAMAMLSADGTLLFSNNFRRFKLDTALAAEFQVEDITRQSIPEDFARNNRIHHCWRIRHPVH